MSEDLTKKLPHTADEKLTLVLSTVQATAVRVDELEHRFDRLEEKVDERLYDTRPIWQKLVIDIGQLQGTVDQVHKNQEVVRSDCDEIKMSIRDIYDRFDVLSESLLGTQVRNRDLDRRLKALESNSTPPNSQT